MTRFFPDTFLSTLSLRRATVTVLGIQHRVGISIHALLAESDIGPLIFNVQPRNFYPRSPCGERHACLSLVLVWSDYFYPRSPCGERPINKLYDHLRDKISIHALLAESDTIFAVRPYDAPIFLSTLSLRRATIYF